MITRKDLFYFTNIEYYIKSIDLNNNMFSV